MKHYYLIFTLFVFCLTFHVENILAQSSDPISVKENSLISESTLKKLRQDERAGVKYFRKGKFEKAFGKLKNPAENGLKQAQYLIGFMYLRGNHVPRSVLEGMAWLGVAKEMEVTDWIKTFDNVYKLSNEVQKQAIDTKVEKYILLYGIEAQQLSCVNRSRAGSRRTEIDCRKRSKSKLDRMQSLNNN